MFAGAPRGWRTRPQQHGCNDGTALAGRRRTAGGRGRFRQCAGAVWASLCWRRAQQGDPAAASVTTTEKGALQPEPGPPIPPTASGAQGQLREAALLGPASQLPCCTTWSACRIAVKTKEFLLLLARGAVVMYVPLKKNKDFFYYSTPGTTAGSVKYWFCPSGVHFAW